MDCVGITGWIQGFYDGIVRRQIYTLSSGFFSLTHRPTARADRVTIPVDGVRTLTAIHRFAADNGIASPTVVMFHGNGMTGDSWVGSLIDEYYLSRGFNVLMFTIGGYPGSRGVTPSETSNYQDVEAVKAYLEKQGVVQVGYHGFSLGAALATQAAVGETATRLHTCFVVLECPFTSVRAVAERAVARHSVLSYMRGAIVASVHRLFPIGKRVVLAKDVATTTDGLNVFAKVAKFAQRQIPLLVFKGCRDSMMGDQWNPSRREYSVNFADEIIAARYGLEPDCDENLIVLGGGHGASFLENTHAVSALDAFLASAKSRLLRP